MKIKPFAQISAGTKVTSEFGPASANIYPDCVIRDQNKFKKKHYEGKNRDAETEGFLTNRAADRGGNHPDHCSYRHSELAARPYGRERVVRCGRRSYHQ